MRGRCIVNIHDSNVKYHLVLERSITVIKGKSGTGKSTLYRMFEDLEKSNKRSSGIYCNCKDKIIVLKERDNWKSIIESSKGMIFVADEYVEYIQTLEFASLAQKSGNYFILISRSGRMKWFTYSVNSVYELESKKDGDIYCTRLYNRYLNIKESVLPDLIITEDSNAGMDMINRVVNCKVISAEGRDGVYNAVDENKNKYKCIYAIVDGAAFGSCIGRLEPLIQEGYNIYVFAPESFEFLLLNSKTFSRYLTGELSETYNYCDSEEFLSWERYYTSLLNTLCSNNYHFFYSKNNLHKFFKTEYFEDYIKCQLVDLDSSVFK